MLMRVCRERTCFAAGWVRSMRSLMRPAGRCAAGRLIHAEVKATYEDGVLHPFIPKKDARALLDRKAVPISG